jgi:phage terminase small subunit
MLIAKSVDVPSAPSWLKGAALEKWMLLWQILDPSRVKPALHSDVVALYCQAYADFREAVEKSEIARDNRDRTMMELRNSAMRQMIDLGIILGLSPDGDHLEWDDFAPTVPRRESDEAEGDESD